MICGTTCQHRVAGLAFAVNSGASPGRTRALPPPTWMKLATAPRQRLRRWLSARFVPGDQVLRRASSNVLSHARFPGDAVEHADGGSRDCHRDEHPDKAAHRRHCHESVQHGSGADVLHIRRCCHGSSTLPDRPDCGLHGMRHAHEATTMPIVDGCMAKGRVAADEVLQTRISVLLPNRLSTRSTASSAVALR